MLSRNRVAGRNAGRLASRITGAGPGPAGDSRLTVYFDATCGLCGDIACLLDLLDWRRQLRFVGLQDAALDVADAPPLEALGATMHVRNERGAWATGAAGCLWIAQRIPLLWVIAIAGRLPRAVVVLERAYARVAGNRHRIGVLVGSGACAAEKP